MIGVVTYIQTAGSEKFKEFLTLSFGFGQISEKFEGWKAKNMGTWIRYTNEDKDTLEIFAETYNMCHKSKVFTLPHPKTLNDFINDMDRVGIQLYWGDWIDGTYDPKDYLHKDEIRNYYFTLLDKLGKSNELQ